MVARVTRVRLLLHGRVDGAVQPPRHVHRRSAASEGQRVKFRVRVHVGASNLFLARRTHGANTLAIERGGAVQEIPGQDVGCLLPSTALLVLIC